MSGEGCFLFVKNNRVRSKRSMWSIALEKNYNQVYNYYEVINMRKFEESQTLELKSVITTDIKKEVIAFANTNGGEIYVGIDDDGKIIGLDDVKNELERISNMFHDGIKPDITPFISLDILVIDGKDIIKVNVFRGEKTPYYLSDKGLKPSGVYIRHGNTSTQASDKYIRKLIRENDKIDYESLISKGQDLTFSYAESFFKEKSILFGDAQKKTLGFISKEREYTNLGLLFSDQCEASIKCARYMGDTKEVFMDRKEFTGSILKQLEDVFNYLMHNHNSISSRIEGLYRKDSFEYPDVALREALLNCIVHKDYDFNSNTLIHIYENRIEFLNVGGLMNGISMESIMLGVSITRNTKLANIFYRLDLVESFGTGIGRIVQSYNDSIEKPSFISRDQAFLVTLPNMKFKKKETINSPIYINEELSSEERLIIEYLEQNNSINRQGVEKLIGISKTAAINLINELLKKKNIYALGKGRAVKYYLKN